MNVIVITIISQCGSSSTHIFINVQSFKIVRIFVPTKGSVTFLHSYCFLFQGLTGPIGPPGPGGPNGEKVSVISF